MTSGCAKSPFVRAKKSHNRKQISLGAPGKEMHSCLRSFDFGTDHGCRLTADRILAVTRSGFRKALFHGLPDARVTAFNVITTEINHKSNLPPALCLSACFHICFALANHFSSILTSLARRTQAKFFHSASGRKNQVKNKNNVFSILFSLSHCKPFHLCEKLASPRKMLIMLISSCITHVTGLTAILSGQSLILQAENNLITNSQKHFTNLLSCVRPDFRHLLT